MHFYIDETGNTGNNLFDANQPVLIYGVVSSKGNLDESAASLYGEIVSRLGVDSIHAAELGAERLASVADLLASLHKSCCVSFDFYFVEKRTYALVQFFEAVFDAGLNDAVPWATYWTPMRFWVIAKLSEIVDEEFLRRSWSLSSTRRIGDYLADVQALLRDFQERIDASSFDPRLKEIARDAAEFGIRFPEKLDFGSSDPRLISPNAVGFQFVTTAIARRLKEAGVNEATAVTVDHQQQFNGAQLRTFDTQVAMSKGLRAASADDREFLTNHPLFAGLAEREELDSLGGDGRPHVRRSRESIGLQIADTYLWIASRFLNGVELPEDLDWLAQTILNGAIYDGISITGLVTRWNRFYSGLPMNADSESLEQSREMVETHRRKVSDLLNEVEPGKHE